MTERRHKKAVRSARKCENLLDRQRGGNKNGYKWRKSVRCRLHRGSGGRKSFLKRSGSTTIFRGCGTFWMGAFRDNDMAGEGPLQKWRM